MNFVNSKFDLHSLVRFDCFESLDKVYVSRVALVSENNHMVELMALALYSMGKLNIA